MESASVFRDANQRIAESVKELSLTGRAPFICECSDERCTEPIALGLDEYEAARSHPARFVTVPGHAVAPHGRVVEENDRFSLIERADVD